MATPQGLACLMMTSEKKEHDLKGGAISIYKYEGGKLAYVETLGGSPAVEEAKAAVKDAAGEAKEAVAEVKGAAQAVAGASGP